MLETHSFSNPILQRKSVIQNKCQLGNTNLKIKKKKKKKVDIKPNNNTSNKEQIMKKVKCQLVIVNWKTKKL